MREIKFRAWDTKRGIWLWECGALKTPATSGEVSRRWELSLKDDVVLQQFTGLKDKNWKEIYEGDILTSNATPPRICEVVYDEACFRVRFGPHNVDAPLHFFLAINYIPYEREAEVIGNIYEHSHLLKP